MASSRSGALQFWGWCPGCFLFCGGTEDLTGSLLSAPVAASVVGGRVVLETCCSFLNNFARCRRLKYCTFGTSQKIFAILTSTVSLTMFSSSACSLASFWANVSRRLRACENVCVGKSVLSSDELFDERSRRRKLSARRCRHKTFAERSAWRF